MQISRQNNCLDYSRIKTSIPLPNLIEIQKHSYMNFLQMDRLGEERDSSGLKGVFETVFPVEDPRGAHSLGFVDYSVGDWQCKCGKLRGLENLRGKCRNCKAVLKSADGMQIITCAECGTTNEDVGRACEICGDMVSLRLRHTEQECKERGHSLEIPLRVTLRLAIYDTKGAGVKELRDIKEEEVYFGDIPLMTSRGTFIINGTERVIVSQLHRSPGIFFGKGKKRKTLYTAKIIPGRGSWIELEYDAKGRLFVRIDRKKRFLVTVFLRALGLESNEAILRKFHKVCKLTVSDEFLYRPLASIARGDHAKADICGSRGKVWLKKGEEFTEEILNDLKKHDVTQLPVTEEEYADIRFIGDIVHAKTGEVIVGAGEVLTSKAVKNIAAAGIKTFEVFFVKEDEAGETLCLTIEQGGPATKQEALTEIYKKMKPGDPVSEQNTKMLLTRMFFDAHYYDLTRVGRLKFNAKFGLNDSLDKRILNEEDFYRVIEYLLKLKSGVGEADDIDHLGNRRVRSVGELLETQFRIGLMRMARAIQEKMVVYKDIKTARPNELINAKPVISAMKEFFCRSQLSQFMDQTNPLAAITHKRRLSALGPGGLSRERAGFEVRDVHPSHYGRICPIETPEGPNIGLIASLSTYARVNEFGFIESPYRKVEDGRVADYVKITETGVAKYKVGQVVKKDEAEKTKVNLPKRKGQTLECEEYPFYLTALEEEKYYIAQANTPFDAKGRIIPERVTVRKSGDVMEIEREKVNYMDVSPKQIVSVAAALIPFLEHDDANRALMGSNMQRQSVPLLAPKAPIVLTGLEESAARDSGAVVVCERNGIVDKVDNHRIVVRIDLGKSTGNGEQFGGDIYILEKFQRSNQKTCVNQKPCVKEGDVVKKGQVLADGPATDNGVLALGRDVMVAFMPWRGYNFEDAIVVSERLVREDIYTSIHIEEFDIEARDTKLGPEEITRDIPNISEKLLQHLDASGISYIGAWVKPGDIIVGKITPKGETQLTPEEKLLRAIFGEKARDVKDASLRVPPGTEGVVVDVKIFSRKDVKPDKRAKEIEEFQIAEFERDKKEEIRIIEDELHKRYVKLLSGQKSAVSVKHGSVSIKKGRVLKPEELSKLPASVLKKIKISKTTTSEKTEKHLLNIEKIAAEKKKIIEKHYRDKAEMLKGGEELLPGVIKVVKVYIAMRRKLSAGDKMAGRHGNKGVIAKILPEEDMPYLADGTPMDVVLNPIGVPSRMNAGQILETHIGWAAKVLGYSVVCPVFDGAKEGEIKELLRKAGLPESGKTVLYDGRTGRPFEQEVAIGYMYLMKLVHLADDKIHARSTGPYSLVTQQPLGGKAQFGGQRLGEMEVWALEAYGAAHTLQEFLTAKSDDVFGRTKMYESIVKGEISSPPELPESFNVMVRELRSLGLDVELQIREPARKQILDRF